MWVQERIESLPTDLKREWSPKRHGVAVGVAFVFSPAISKAPVFVHCHCNTIKNSSKWKTHPTIPYAQHIHTLCLVSLHQIAHGGCISKKLFLRRHAIVVGAKTKVALASQIQAAIRSSGDKLLGSRVCILCARSDMWGGAHTSVPDLNIRVYLGSADLTHTGWKLIDLDTLSLLLGHYLERIEPTAAGNFLRSNLRVDACGRSCPLLRSGGVS